MKEEYETLWEELLTEMFTTQLGKIDQTLNNFVVWELFQYFYLKK